MERGDRWFSDGLKRGKRDQEIARIDQDGKRMWRSALRYSALGLEMGVAAAIGYGIGWWLDSRFGTRPYLMLVMLLLGIAAGFRGLIRAAREAAREQDEQDEQDKQDKQDNDGKQG